MTDELITECCHRRIEGDERYCPCCGWEARVLLAGRRSMTMRLDSAIFGGGFGLSQPHFDGVFYWISGRFYTWIGGFGAQLQSLEWLPPRAGTRRRLAGSEFVIFSVHRRWVKVRCSWALCQHMPITIEELALLKKRLNDL